MNRNRNLSPRTASWSMKVRHRLFMLVSASVLSLGPLTAAAQSGRARRARDGAPKACGVERWRVKILADESLERIRWEPETTTVAALRRIAPPRVQLPAARRIAPHELTLYRVHAIVRQILYESDGDWHLVLADPDGIRQTIVAEVPDSACALGSGHEGDYAAARRALRAMPREALVELDGVGFFDYLHGQRGMAPNGFELHPVVAIRPLDVESEQGIDSSASVGRDRTEAAGRTDSATRTGADVQVWLNTNSFVYHCAGSRWYGKTKYGELMRESHAVARGARPADGHRCSG